MSDEYIVETYAEAVAIARALSATGDDIEVHASDCEVDEHAQGCTCDPVVLVAQEMASA